MILFGLAVSAIAAEGFYQWTTEEGVHAYTDDVKQVPERYREQATQRTWGALREVTEAQITPQSTNHPVPTWDYQPDAKPAPQDCKGYVTITQMRVQQGDYNREMFVARDSCGKVVSVTPQRPRMDINR